MKTLLALLFLAILVAAGVVISSARLMTATYYVAEPYVITETYYVTENESDTTPLNYEVVDSKIYNWWWRISSDCTVTIKNIDTESGYFRVEFNIVTKATDTAPSKKITKAAWQAIAPGKQADFTVRQEGAYIENFTYSTTPPTKIITTSQEVPKTRDIILYREAPKTEKVTVLEYLTR